jgi:hypothetical protein
MAAYLNPHQQAGPTMTVMVDRFFGVPQSAIRLGKMKNLSGVAIKLYVALWYESERCSTRELTRTTKVLIDLVGGSRNSHNKARAELIQGGLVLAEPYGTDGFVFVLCNPETGKPWPVHSTERVIYQPKGRPPVTANQDAAKPVTRKKPPKIEDAGTNFLFGHNAPDFVATTPTCQETIQPPSWDECGSLHGDHAQKLSTPMRNYRASPRTETEYPMSNSSV